jgi:hypothetical protein
MRLLTAVDSEDSAGWDATAEDHGRTTPTARKFWKESPGNRRQDI